MNKPENNRKNQQAYKQRMSETHTSCRVWIENETIERINALAAQETWLNKTGRAAGEVNLQQAINEILKSGLDSLEDKDAL